MDVDTWKCAGCGTESARFPYAGSGIGECPDRYGVGCSWWWNGADGAEANRLQARRSHRSALQIASASEPGMSTPEE